MENQNRKIPHGFTSRKFIFAKFLKLYGAMVNHIIRGINYRINSSHQTSNE